MFGLSIIFGFRWNFGYFHPLILMTGLLFIGMSRFLYRSRRATAAVLNKLRRREGVLASWTCPDPAWSTLTHAVLRKEVQRHRRGAAQMAAGIVLLGVPGWCAARWRAQDVSEQSFAA